MSCCRTQNLLVEPHFFGNGGVESEAIRQGQILGEIRARCCDVVGMLVAQRFGIPIVEIGGDPPTRHVIWRWIADALYRKSLQYTRRDNRQLVRSRRAKRRLVLTAEDV